MFYLDKGTYLRFIVVDGEVTLVDTARFPEDDPSNKAPFLEALNRDFLYMPNWEAVGALTMLEFREDKNTARFYVPADVFYDFKKVMRSKAWEKAKELYPATSFEYNEMPEGNFPELTQSHTFTRREDGGWTAGEVPVGRALYSSVQNGDTMSFSDEILRLADMLPEACGKDGQCSCGPTCSCGEDSDCGCGGKTASWYEEGSASNWYDEGREAGDDYEDDEDDDEVVDAKRKRTPRSRQTDYRKRRKYLKKNPAKRRERNRKQRKRRRKGPNRQNQKRYRKRTKNSPRSKRRSPRKF